MTSRTLALLLLSPLSAMADGLAWQQLDNGERAVLAPLQDDWSRLSAARKDRFVAIARKAASLPSAERQRLQQNLKSWAMLSEAEQARARQNWQIITSLPPDQRSRALARLKTPVR